MNKMTMCLAALAAFMLASCGETLAELPVEEGAKPFVMPAGTINGKAMKLYPAHTFIERARAQQLADLSMKDNAVALVYGGEAAPISFTPTFYAPADIAFLDGEGTVVTLLSGEKGYLPQGMPRSGDSGPNIYRSERAASIALFVSAGRAADLGITAGSKVTITPDPTQLIAQADPNGAALHFTKRIKTDRLETENPPPPITVQVRVAASAEERARGIIEGENALLMLAQDRDTDWLRDGIWLKGKEGAYCIAFMRLQSPNSAAGAHYGIVTDVIENAKDEGADDLSRARWWPSRPSVDRGGSEMRIQGGHVNGTINAVLIMRGDKTMSTRGIAENMFVDTHGPLFASTKSYPSFDNYIEKNSFEGLTLLTDGKRSGTTVAITPERIDALVSALDALPASDIGLILWDTKDRARASNYGSRSVKLALLAEPKGNITSVAKIVEIAAGSPNAAIADAPSRYALVSRNASLVQGASVELPWQAVDIKPSRRWGAFFSGEKPDKTANTAPANAKVRVLLEAAETEPDISRGLMFRASLPENEGMIFTFPKSSHRRFWMKNCLMDIDVAFLNDDLEIISIHQMKKEPPETPDGELKSYSSGKTAKYAVEMAGGWFAARGIKTGDRLWLPSTQRDRQDTN